MTLCTKGNVAIIGLGYVGLPLASLLVDKGYVVLGIDTDIKKVERLNAKKSYLTDVSDFKVSEMIDNQKFIPSSDYSLISSAQSIIICVPTPLREKVPDLSYIISAVQGILPYLKREQLLILESSTYPGTTNDLIKPLVESKGLKVGKDIFLAYSPERINPGSKDVSLVDIPKVVSGISTECLQRVSDLYGSIFKTIVKVSSPRVAEFVKMLENSQRLINISFINEVNLLANKMNISIWEVIEAAKTKPIGFTPYYPSAGVGGHCIPIDPFFLSWIGMKEGVPLTMIHQAGIINEKIPYFVAEKVIQHLQAKNIPLHDAKIGAIGITYKKDINDIRESAPLKVVQLLQKEKINVSVYDPIYQEELPNGLTRFSLQPNQLRALDITLILIDHSNIEWGDIIAHSNCVMDTQNVTRDYTEGHIIRI
ncbi:hypothetical protein AM501_06050 [Aneurinibacillus migulanus]|uniref:UDP-glucose/GDP-mannose dehydrogenase C-terminal domain-containing protein n=1 Tax=Aneurinibacillus migulanus TaxID=47500 RepID=A0A0M0HBM5_ANEMI|nr:hypothetical protein AF333_00890 [Aneurinibacillus migulanus]KPD09137.1 hypothetical protein AM501_06050 [Aneurinibacillus migulanus]